MYPLDYDIRNDNSESLVFCPGADKVIDLSQYDEKEIVFTHEYNTYCPIIFCGKADACRLCNQLNNPKTLK